MAITGKKYDAFDSAGRPVKGIYRRECGRYQRTRGVVTVELIDYEITFNYFAAGERIRTRFGKESDHGGRWSPAGEWLSDAYDKAVEKLDEYRRNAVHGGIVTKAGEKIEIKRKLEQKKLLAEKERTFTSLSDEYVNSLRVRPKTIRGYRDGLALAAEYKPAKGLPTIGETIIKDVSRRHLAQCIEAIAKRSPSTAVSVRSSLSAFFTWLAEPSREYIEGNFIPSIPKPDANKPRERRLKDDELVTLWKALEGENAGTLARLVKFLFLTGCRLSEAVNMDRREIDGQWWTIPGKRTKSGRPHRVYLTPLSLSLIEGKTHPFYNEETGKSFSLASVNHYLVRRKWFDLPRFSPHDARRTVGSGLAELGFHSDIISAILSHKLPGVTQQHYLRQDQDPEKKRAWLAWEAHLVRITTGEAAKVVILTERR